jgi:hypothetical protein
LRARPRKRRRNRPQNRGGKRLGNCAASGWGKRVASAAGARRKPRRGGSQWRPNRRPPTLRGAGRKGSLSILMSWPGGFDAISISVAARKPATLRDPVASLALLRFPAAGTAGLRRSTQRVRRSRRRARGGGARARGPGLAGSRLLGALPGRHRVQAPALRRSLRRAARDGPRSARRSLPRRSPGGRGSSARGRSTGRSTISG